MDFKGQECCNDAHASTTGANVRLFKKSQGDKSRLCHIGDILTENRNGLPEPKRPNLSSTAAFRHCQVGSGRVGMTDQLKGSGVFS